MDSQGICSVECKDNVCNFECILLSCKPELGKAGNGLLQVMDKCQTEFIEFKVPRTTVEFEFTGRCNWS